MAATPLGDFAKLPPELRVMIVQLVVPQQQFDIDSVRDFKSVFDPNTIRVLPRTMVLLTPQIYTIAVPPSSVLPLAFVSRAVRSEFLPVFHRESSFCLLREPNNVSYADRWEMLSHAIEDMSSKLEWTKDTIPILQNVSIVCQGPVPPEHDADPDPNKANKIWEIIFDIEKINGVQKVYWWENIWYTYPGTSDYRVDNERRRSGSGWRELGKSLAQDKKGVSIADVVHMNRAFERFMNSRFF